MTRQAPSTALTYSRYSMGIYGMTFLENNFILPRSKGGVGKEGSRPQGSQASAQPFSVSSALPEGWRGGQGFLRPLALTADTLAEPCLSLSPERSPHNSRSGPDPTERARGVPNDQAEWAGGAPGWG